MQTRVNEHATTPQAARWRSEQCDEEFDATTVDFNDILLVADEDDDD
jgi:hypothetical protein